MNGVLAGLRFQFWLMKRTIDNLQALVLAPLFTLIFVGLVVAAGRPGLVPVAAVGAALVSLWNMCVHVGGNMIDTERRGGTLESLVSSRSTLHSVISGRAAAVLVVALLIVPEVWLVTLGVFRVAVRVHHPLLFAASLVLCAVGLHGAATLLSGLAVLAKNRVVLQNALNYPFFLLGGLFVPVTQLPEWIQPLTRIIFLSWASDLLRASVSPGPVAHAAAALSGLVITVLCTVAAGWCTLSYVLRRARVEGTLSYT